MLNSYMLYDFPFGQERWPESIIEEFREYFRSPGQAVLLANSDEHRRFIAAISAHGLDPVESRFIDVRKDKIHEWPYYYFSFRAVSNRRLYADILKSFTYAPACTRARLEGTGFCPTRHDQVFPITYDPERWQHLPDFFTVRLQATSRVYIVSRRMAVALISDDFTGFDLVACAEETARPVSNSGLCPVGDLDQVSDGAEYFQLLVNSRPCAGRKLRDAVAGSPPARARRLTRREQSRCRECGVVFEFSAQQYLPYHFADLAGRDFLIEDQYESEKLGMFHYCEERLIVSSRVLELFLRHKFQGMTRCLEKPYPEFQPVEIYEYEHLLS